MSIVIGRVVRVRSVGEALTAFNACAGVAGVVWQNKIDLPALNDNQKQNLTQSHVMWNREDGLSIDYGTVPISDELKPYFDLAADDIKLANQFMGNVRKRKHFFLWDADLGTISNLSRGF